MVRLVAALAVTIVLGLLSRRYPVGWVVYDKYWGEALYAIAIYLAQALLLYRLRPAVIAALALLTCLAIETYQATSLPTYVAHIPFLRWLLGDTFSWYDIAGYVVGVALITPLDMLLLRPRLPPLSP
jgi:hypothetical protein